MHVIDVMAIVMEVSKCYKIQVLRHMIDVMAMVMDIFIGLKLLYM